jgi:site-specific recombinase XerD
MSRTTSRLPLDRALEAHLRLLATTLQPATIHSYEWVVRRCLRYLRETFPLLRWPADLRRDPHMLGWIRSLYESKPPLSNTARRTCLLCMRRLLDDLAGEKNGPPVGILLLDDLPRRDQYLPKPLSPEDDGLLDRELRRTDDLRSNALLLLRATGMRIGECRRLPVDCVRDLGQQQWAIYVPLGKLHTDRWVPIDDDVLRIVARILDLRSHLKQPLPPDLDQLLIPLSHDPRRAYDSLRRALALAGERAGCSVHCTPHKLRHTYATEMLRAGVSLPALKQLLGHRSITMTMHYVQISQNDLQREYHRALQNIARIHVVPALPAAKRKLPGITTRVPAIADSVEAARRLIEMYRRDVPDGGLQRQLARLANRLKKISTKFLQLTSAAK